MFIYFFELCFDIQMRLIIIKGKLISVSIRVPSLVARVLEVRSSQTGPVLPALEGIG